MKKLLVMILVVVMALSATAFAEATYTLRLATNLAEDHVACKGYYAFADAVKEATDGQVEVIVYSGEQLGKESDVTSAVAMNLGTTDIVCCGIALLLYLRFIKKASRKTSRKQPVS